MVLEHVINEWRSFRRALRGHDHSAFDALMTHAREHAGAASNAARLNPTESLFMAILLEHEKAIEQLKRELKTETTPEAKRAGECDDK
jgi:hypothetical protein